MLILGIYVGAGAPTLKLKLPLTQAKLQLMLVLFSLIIGPAGPMLRLNCAYTKGLWALC